MAKQLVSWSSIYCLGLEEIDVQHKSLFEIINTTWKAIVERANPSVTLALMEQLETYTLAHFAAEETFMRVTEYPEFNSHKREHQKFVVRVTEEKKALLAGGNISLDLVYFLKDWLIDHILLSDKDYAEFTRRSKDNKGISMLGRFFKRFW